MPVPTVLADLSTTLSNNSPPGAETVGTNLDDYLRAGFGLLAQVNANKLETSTASSTYAPIASPTFTGSATFASGIKAGTVASFPAGFTSSSASVFGFSGSSGAIISQSTQTTGNSDVRVISDDYGTNFNTVSMRMYGSAASGTTYGFANAHLGILDFVNTSNAVIATNAGTISFAPQGTSKLTLDGTTGLRIKGDFSNTTIASRVLFQNTGGANDETAVGVIPPIGSTVGVWYALGNTDPANTSLISFGMNDGLGYSFLNSFHIGTGTTRPIRFFIDTVEKFGIETNGYLRSDFSNATVASRGNFQSNVANGNTGIVAVPNGSATVAAWQVIPTATPTANESRGQFAIVGGSEVSIRSDIVGAGTYLPLKVYTGGASRIEATINGNVTVNNPASGVGFTVAGGGASITGTTALDATSTVGGLSIGYRNLPQSASTTAATTDVGKSIVATSTITIPNSTFAAGDCLTIYNNSAAAITLTCNTTTTRIAGTATTGTTRTLAQRGQCTAYFLSATELILSGNVT